MHTNRAVNKAHIDRLAAAIGQDPDSGLVRPILVNEKMEIIDGQHRFLASQQLGIPIYYLVGEGLGIEDAQKFNALQRNWTELDYAKSYADAGFEDYICYLRFRQKYGISHSVSVAFLSQRGGGGRLTDIFRSGYFKVNNYQKAEVAADQLREFGKYHPYWRQKGFGIAFKTMLDNPKYDRKLMVRHAKMWAEKFLKNTSDIPENLRNLEKLYNFRLGEENKIRLF